MLMMNKNLINLTRQYFESLSVQLSYLCTSYVLVAPAYLLHVILYYNCDLNYWTETCK